MKEVVITLTTVDTMTDVYMIYLYKVNGLDSDANALITMIATNTIVQLLTVLAQNKKKSWKTLLKEWLITLLFLRPFVDAWRVHNIKKQQHTHRHTTSDPLSEMISNKATELATESIPGCVLQCYVLLLNPSLGSSGAIISIGGERAEVVEHEPLPN